MAKKKANGEGSIYQRKNGRWVAAAFVETTSGQRKRIHIYGSSRQEVHGRLMAKLAEATKGVRTPDQEWTVGDFLDYWLETVVAIKTRATTQASYELCVRLYLKPAIGSIRLSKLSIQDAQRVFNNQLASGLSTATVHITRGVLRAALSRAEREELIVRNIAKLVDIPAKERKPIRPWSKTEAARFLASVTEHILQPAFILLLVYGMRKGEVLGLRWCDVDFDQDRLYVRQQLQRIRGRLEQGPVKTTAGQRTLPLIPIVHNLLVSLYSSRYGAPRSQLEAERMNMNEQLVFLTATGRPLDPTCFSQTFHDLRKEAGLRRITVHHTRHTAATMLKNLGVPARDAQLILGHTHISTTQQLYQHADIEGQTRALIRAGELVAGRVAVTTAVNREFSTHLDSNFRALAPVGAAKGGDGSAQVIYHQSAPNNQNLTPVIKHLRIRTNAQLLGRVAVNYCCHGTPVAAPLGQLVAFRSGLDLLERHLDLRRRFPFEGRPPETDPPDHSSMTTPESISERRPYND